MYVPDLARPPPPCPIRADLDTPVSAWLKLAPLRPAFLLESAPGAERPGRWSLLGLADADRVSVPSGAGIAGLRAALAAAPALPALPGLPFDGGLVGVTAFDFVRQLERLPSRHAPTGLAHARFVAPRAVLAWDHATRRTFLMFAGPDAERDALAREIAARLAGPVALPARGRLGPVRASMDRAAFHAAFAEAQRHLRAGDVFQLVLSIAHVRDTDLDPIDAYRALRQLNPSPHQFLLALGDEALVGASPEILARLEGTRAALRPIAGTRPRGATPAQDRALEAELLADPKEAAEHAMLVDLARNDLGRVARAGTVAVAVDRAIERYSHVMHLVSGVEAELDAGLDAFDLFAAAFPAGTVTGAPKLRACERIDQLEPAPRGAYGGTVGYFARSGAMEQALAIRTLTFRAGTVTAQAGAGIVLDSDADRELAEIHHKLAAQEAALRAAAEEVSPCASC